MDTHTKLQRTRVLSKILIVDGGGPELLYNRSITDQNEFTGSEGDSSRIALTGTVFEPVLTHTLTDGTVYEYRVLAGCDRLIRAQLVFATICLHNI